MITSLITTPGESWTSADLTGNGQFVQTDSSTIYIVTNTLNDNTFDVLKSSDKGESFSVVASHAFSATKSQFDPAISYDATNSKIHIIGSTSNSSDDSLMNLLKFTYDILIEELSTPTVILTGSRIHSGYDILTFSDETHLVVTTATNSLTPAISEYAMIELVLNSANAVTSSAVIGTTTSIRSGEVYGGISLVKMANGTDAELYYTAHTKKLFTGLTTQQVRTRTKISDVWSAPTTLTDYLATYIDDKMTVIPYTGGLWSADRVMVHLYYIQNKGKLKSILKLGARTAGTWKFVEYAGSEVSSKMEPTLYTNNSGTVGLAYLEGNLNTTPRQGYLNISVLNLTTLQLSPWGGLYNHVWQNLAFSWIRGSKHNVDSDSIWMIVGEQLNEGTLSPLFLSEFNLPPDIILTSSSTTLNRESLLRVDASQTRDPDMDPMKFVWNVSNPAAILYDSSHTIVETGVPSDATKVDVWIPKSIGPTAQTLTISLEVRDYYNDPAVAIPHIYNTASLVLNIPFNHAPEISWGPEVQTLGGGQFLLEGAPRNSDILLTPIITDSDGDSLTYSWSQTGGATTLEIIGPSTLEYLHLRTHGVNVFGENAEFTLTVSDGINTPVVATITLEIVSIQTANLDTHYLTRSFFCRTGAVNFTPKNTISQRTEIGEWPTAQTSSLSTDFFKMKHNTTLDGFKRQTYIAKHSVLVFGESDPSFSAYYYRKFFLPGNVGDILDAVHTDNESTYILTVDGILYRYDLTGPENLSDYPQFILDLRPHLNAGFLKSFQMTQTIQGVRVMAFATTKGLLLTQVREEDMHLEGIHFLSSFNYSLYGGDDVEFVRFNNVENLRIGQILIGTSAPKDDTNIYSKLEFFQTLYDLDSRSVIAVWDKTNRINQIVHTGEVLNASPANYSGVLQAPILSIAEDGNGGLELTWVQVRPDLVDSYYIYGGPDLPYVIIPPTPPTPPPAPVPTVVATYYPMV